MKISFASNDSPTTIAFTQRQEYTDNYPAGIRNYRKINFWYNDILFGRVDRKGDVVYPVQKSLKELSAPGHYSVLNFVSDAYDSFVADMLTQERHNHFINLDGTPFASRFEPTRAWVNTGANYSEYIKDYYNSFMLPFMSQPGNSEDILDFDDFVVQFTRMLDRTSLLIPFTRTEYVASKFSSPLSSGLMIEFAEADHGDDFPKILDFINNINFELYREIASRNGFAVDINAPWRLIADIGSDAMQRFMGAHNATLDTVFGDYYHKASLMDVPNLKIYLREYYNAFVRAYPKVRVPRVVNKNGRNISLTSAEKRVILTEDEYNVRYDNVFWIRLYIYMRAKETNRDWDQHKFDHVVQRATDFYLYSDELAAFKFINKEVKRPPGEYSQVPEYRRGDFRFKRKRE